jgi:hypothetical protein
MKYLKVDKMIAEETYDLSAKYLSDSGVSSDRAIQAAIETSVGPADSKVEPAAVADFTLLREVVKSFRR